MRSNLERCQMARSWMEKSARMLWWWIECSSWPLRRSNQPTPWSKKQLNLPWLQKSSQIQKIQLAQLSHQRQRLWTAQVSKTSQKTWSVAFAWMRASPSWSKPASTSCSAHSVTETTSSRTTCVRSAPSAGKSSKRRFKCSFADSVFVFLIVWANNFCQWSKTKISSDWLTKIQVCCL